MSSVPAAQDVAEEEEEATHALARSAEWAQAVRTARLLPSSNHRG